jgi:2-polyprenyl-6-methoxyphenol hydroxylase-like FAD-dependent oxidoreductase
MPTIHDAIKHAAPVGPVYRFGFPASIRRHFETLECFPNGLLPIGDVICRFSPAFGQGMSVAAQEISILLGLLEARAREPDPLRGLPPAFFAAIQSALATPWAVAEADFMFAKTRGRPPSDLPERMRFNAALQRLAIEDAGVHQIMSEVNHLMRPSSALRDPQIVSRVTARMAPT